MSDIPTVLQFTQGKLVGGNMSVKKIKNIWDTGYRSSTERRLAELGPQLAFGPSELGGAYQPDNTKSRLLRIIERLINQPWTTPYKGMFKDSLDLLITQYQATSLPEAINKAFPESKGYERQNLALSILVKAELLGFLSEDSVQQLREIQEQPLTQQSQVEAISLLDQLKMTVFERHAEQDAGKENTKAPENNAIEYDYAAGMTSAR